VNFLAHAVLAGSVSAEVAGSTAGDFVKGVLYDDQYPASFLFGVRLHRRLDAFSNQHELLRRSANRLPNSLRRIAPPCIDMIADHFLARAALAEPSDYLPAVDGQLLHPSLRDYEDWVHSSLTPHWDLLSDSAQRFFTHAKSTRLFSSYADFDRTSRGIVHVCERLGRSDQAPAVIQALAAARPALEADFHGYWPELLAEAQRFQAAVA